jgi:hypothetical protein
LLLLLLLLSTAAEVENVLPALSQIWQHLHPSLLFTSLLGDTFTVVIVAES